MPKKRRDRPAMPPGYGVPEGTAGMLAWHAVAKRLAAAKNYWLITARPDGRPHVMPVWAVWLDGTLCFGTDRRSRKSRNIAANPAVAVNLDNSEEPVILEGTAHELLDPARLAEIDKAYTGKYGMQMSDAPGDLAVFGVHPLVVFAWREKDFPRSATRWRFEQT